MPHTFDEDQQCDLGNDPSLSARLAWPVCTLHGNAWCRDI